MHSSVVEHGIADPAVTGSNPVVPSFLVGVVGNISACHADARGSIPRLGVFFFSPKITVKYTSKNEVLPGLEPGSLDSESRVITITL